ncbi:Serine/Threonine protein kinase and Signal Transduction Histidine Kinase (STHK) with GAF sensor [Calothrix sp. PCC 7716]|nr:Serine/Threonine protein kinase and Signal Transduction Histidine Kinase (STHK) with GAF sensor [Calothrix sp. PCC 7716]
MFSTQVSIPGYQVSKEIYNGSRTVVYQGYRESDQKPVAIKVLKNPYPNFNELLQFRNQYTIAKNLKFSGIIQTYSLEPYENGYALVTEDFGGVPIKEYFASRQIEYITHLQEFLHTAISLCDILETLYQQYIIHKDIKPANILINPETKQVKLIDFSIASLLARESQEIKSPNVLEGTLAYLSPEQTGRMNRGIDYRSDFYSLGVTFYELLTGELPFKSNDPMELVHCHIAKTPSFLNKNEEMPEAISDIVMKLMAKNAEDRYQSVFGLKYDLEQCLYQIKANKKNRYFEIGKRDICERFSISEKLYGREKEVEQLIEVFERVSAGNSELMLVVGFSGIGKTAVVSEVHKPIIKQRGYFIKGKFDQFNRNIPFSAFVQAFRDLMGQLLTESDKQLQQWKSKILTVLGDNVQVIIEVIPELEKIIGQQSPAPELSGSAAQNRFNLLFQKFLQIFTQKEHPLVIFLDDLQWADSASLQLMQLLTIDNHQGYLLLIGAYRDNEVSTFHPLMLTLDAIGKKKAIINKIILQPLSQINLNQLVADTLKCTEELAFSLSQLIYRKTKGNPFFVTQFFKSLHQDALIEFNFKEGCWQCDISQINQKTLTDDVIHFLVIQLEKLPESTQRVLKFAACIGNQFDLETLAIICQLSEVEVAASLWKALQSGFILAQSNVYKFYQDNSEQSQLQTSHRQIAKYKFLHDRVQQAAYSLIPIEKKQSTHLEIGQLLLSHTPVTNQEENLFEIVNQLNMGKSLIVELSKQTQLAKLNLKAGQKARNATAYAAALEYLTTGIYLLAENRWQTQYDLSLALYTNATEAAYLSGNYQQMAYLAAVILEHTRTILDRVEVYQVKIQAAQAQAQPSEAIEIALQILQQLGVSFPEQPNEHDIRQAMGETLSLLAGRQPLELIALPQMTDPKQLAIMGILASVTASAYVAAPTLLPLIMLEQVKLSLQYGNSSFSPDGYCGCGIILCGVAGDIEAGYQFGQLALLLLEQLDTKKLKARTYGQVNCCISHWKEPLVNTLTYFREGYQSGLEVGDLEWGGICAVLYLMHAWFAGKELSDLSREGAAICLQFSQLRQETMSKQGGIFQQAILNLLSNYPEAWHFAGDTFNEAEYLPILLEAGNQTALCYLNVSKLVLCYLFGQIDQAITTAGRLENYLGAATGMSLIPVFHTYDSLVHLAIYSQVSEIQQQKILERVTNNQDKMRKWAFHAPANQLHKFYLVEAELHRVLDSKIEVIDFYERAISGAKENGYIQEEALSNELAAKFYLQWGKEKIAQTYMQEAYYCYARWGAKAKTDDLEKRYPQLLKAILQQRRINLKHDETIATIARSSTSRSTHTDSTDSTNISDVLDFTSVLKAAQAISSTIELDELITNLTKIILENSGAKKAVLILPQDNYWQVRAITFIHHEHQLENDIQNMLVCESIDTCEYIPSKIINYVKNTQATVVVDNCQTNIPGIIGKYMLQHQPKSVLCTPIIKQGHLVGVLYLENKVTSGVFTQERLQVINLLSSQAAISLENARLYQEAQEALQNLQQAQLQIVQSEKMSALGNLVAGVAHEMNNPLGFIAASLKQAKPTFTDITEHLKLYQVSLPKPSDEILDHAEEIDLNYSLEDLPKMIDAMVMACDRLKNISTSLRTFSRADKDYKVLFNIHDGLDSTILILKHRLKANEQHPAIEILTEYGDLPQIECYPGQLNQVFMNILANAIDALEEANTGKTFEQIKANTNMIAVKTLIENNHVKISISDNAQGIPEEIKSKIFNHLFTTKSVNKGTGLGLAIARQIVEETHAGKLSCNSILGQGTQFIIEIPM